MEQAINNKLPDDFVYVFWEELKSGIPPKNDKLISTFSKLSKEYELVLLTNYFAKSQLNRLNNMEIGSFFKECYGEKCIKPNENAYLTACGDKKVQECIMIGDDLYLDIEGAKKQGLLTIFVNSKGVETNSNMGIVVNCVEDISKELITQIEEKDFEC